MSVTVISYADGNDSRGHIVGSYATERDARRAAARELGAKSLRGALSWPTQTGVVYQFGARRDTDINPCAELVYAAAPDAADQ